VERTLLLEHSNALTIILQSKKRYLFCDTLPKEHLINSLTSFEEEWFRGAWKNNNRETYTYDTKGNMLIDLEEEWQSDGWKNYNRYTYTYDDKGYKVMTVYEDW
jgi:hypothetical protein